MLLSHRYIQRYSWGVVSPEDAVRAQMLLELLFIRSGAFCLDSFSVSDVKVLIDGLCTSYRRNYIEARGGSCLLLIS